MAYKVFTKDSLPKHPVKTFFRSLLPIPQKLAFAYAEKERYFTKYPKANESIKELIHKPMLNGQDTLTSCY